MGNVTLLEVLYRAETGPMCEERDWDIKVVPQKVSEKLKEHGLQRVYDPKNLVPSDDGLADEFWRAGFELAVDLGVLCTSTRRIIKFGEDELKYCLQRHPKEVRFGSREDQVIVRNRQVEDRNPPICWYGALGMDLDEDLFIPIELSILQYRVVDQVEPGQVRTIYGKERRAGTPLDILGSQRRLDLHRQACDMAGRPGLWVDEPEHCNFISELKINYRSMERVVWQYREGITDRLLNVSYSLGHSIIGGYAGGPEGAAVMRVATTILARPIFLAKVSHNEIFDVRYTGSTNREAIWANSISSQAVARNSHMLQKGSGTTPTAGPCTKMLLQEVAVCTMKDTVNGNSISHGIRPRAGKYPNNATGLEMKFGAEVAKSAAGLKRQDVNEIVNALVSNYEDKLRNPPIGKPFQECFDQRTLKPSDEWLAIYRETWKDLEDLGVASKFQ